MNQTEDGPNTIGNVAASPGSIDGRHKAGGVGAEEDVCVDPHGPVDASTLVPLMKRVQ